MEGTATDGRFRYGRRYSFTLDSVPYGGESWTEGSPGAGGSLGRVFNAGPTPAMRHPDKPTSTLTLKLRHFSARREASTLYITLISKKPRPELNSTQLLGTAPDSAVRIKTQSSKSSIGWLLTGSRGGVEGMRGFVPSTSESSKTKRSKCAPTRKYSLPSAEMLKTP